MSQVIWPAKTPGRFTKYASLTWHRVRKMLLGQMIISKQQLRAAREFDDSLLLQAKFLALSAFRPKLLAPLLAAPEGSLLHRHVQDRPQVLGVLLWPYQCAAWDAQNRVRRIIGHFDALERAPSVFKFGVDDKLMILDLSTIKKGATVILDQPKWFVREGNFTLNIFNGLHRSYSISFSLFQDSIFIGGLQGRSTDGALDLYRNMTKEFFGLRPRDLILDILRIICPLFGVRRIYAVSDNYRYFHHPYFGGKSDKSIYADYDEIWKDRGGRLVEATYWELPLHSVRRPLSEISAKKRSMYRKRYEMLDDLEQRIHREYSIAPLVRFDAT